MIAFTPEAHAALAAEFKASQAENERLSELLKAIARGFRHSDKDNMEFTFVIPYTVNDELRAAVSAAAPPPPTK